jgi:hypothetical protein
MHRRTFLAALAALPGLRWLKPEPTPAVTISNVGGVPISIAAPPSEANRFHWTANRRLPPDAGIAIWPGSRFWFDGCAFTVSRLDWRGDAVALAGESDPMPGGLYLRRLIEVDLDARNCWMREGRPYFLPPPPATLHKSRFDAIRD